MKKKKQPEGEIVSITFKHPSGLEGVMSAKVAEDNTFGDGPLIEPPAPKPEKKSGNKIKSATWNRN